MIIIARDKKRLLFKNYNDNYKKINRFFAFQITHNCNNGRFIISFAIDDRSNSERLSSPASLA